MAKTFDFTGRVVGLDGNVIFESVSGYCVLKSPPRGLKSWSGVLTVESDEPPFLFRDAKLITDDGKEGELFGTRRTVGGSQIAFDGTGPIE